MPHQKQNVIYKVVNDNGIRENSDYSAYNFRSKKHQDSYKQTGKLPTGTPIIFKPAAIELVVQILKNQK